MENVDSEARRQELPRPPGEGSLGTSCSRLEGTGTTSSIQGCNATGIPPDLGYEPEEIVSPHPWTFASGLCRKLDGGPVLGSTRRSLRLFDALRYKDSSVEVKHLGRVWGGCGHCDTCPAGREFVLDAVC